MAKDDFLEKEKINPNNRITLNRMTRIQSVNNCIIFPWQSKYGNVSTKKPIFYRISHLLWFSMKMSRLMQNMLGIQMKLLEKYHNKIISLKHNIFPEYYSV